MHYVNLSREPIEVFGGEPFGTASLMLYCIRNDQRFNINASGIRVAIRLTDKIEKAVKNKSKYVALESKDFELLKQAVENPTPMPRPDGGVNMPYPINNTQKLLPYIDDVLKADDVKPEEEEEDEEATAN